jgi:hypothetical protein
MTEKSQHEKLSTALPGGGSAGEGAGATFLYTLGENTFTAVDNSRGPLTFGLYITSHNVSSVR